MAAGLPVSQLIEEIGHDGSRLVTTSTPGMPEQAGFHPQEVIWPLVSRYGFMITEISDAIIEDDVVPTDLLPSTWDRFQLLRENFHMVYAFADKNGKGHAYAWDAARQLYIDPKNRDRLDVVEQYPAIVWLVKD